MEFRAALIPTLHPARSGADAHAVVMPPGNAAMVTPVLVPAPIVAVMVAPVLAHFAMRMVAVVARPWIGLRATGKAGACQRQSGNCDEYFRLHLASPLNCSCLR